MATTTKTGYINGSDLLLKIDGEFLGSCTSHTTTFSSETKERAVKPAGSKSISAGLWKGKGVTGLSISISGEGLRTFDQTTGEAGFKKLYNAWKAGKSIEVEALERESTKSYLKGKFVIASLEESAPAQDDATYSISLENDGEPESLDDTAITETAATSPASN